MKTLVSLVLYLITCISMEAQMPDICIAATAIQNLKITEDVITFRASGSVKLCVQVDNHPEDILWQDKWVIGGEPVSFADALAENCQFTIRPAKATGEKETDRKRELNWTNSTKLIKTYKKGDKLYISVYTAQITITKNLVVDVTGTGPWTVTPNGIPPHLSDISKADRDKIYWQMQHSKFGVKPPLPIAPIPDAEFQKLQREAETKEPLQKKKS